MVNVSEYTSPMDPMGTGYQTPDFWTINRKGAASWDDVWGEEVTNHPKKTRGCLKTTRWNDHKLHLSSLEVTFFGGEVIGCPYEIHCRNQQCHPLEFLSQWAKTCKNITEHPPPHFSCVCVWFSLRRESCLSRKSTCGNCCGSSMLWNSLKFVNGSYSFVHFNI